MKRHLSILLALTLLLTGCTGKAPPADDAETALFTDSAGREVELPENITRIAPSGGFAQMMLLALAPDMMVSIASEYSFDADEFLSPEFLQLPVVGQFYGSESLNLEEIAAIGPELIIDCGETKSGVAEDMDSITASIGVPAVHISATTGTMGEAFRTLGRLLGREEDAEILAEYCENTLFDIRAIMAEVGEENKAKILYCLGDSGLNVIAAGSYHAEILDMLADNAAVVDSPSSRGTGNEADMEQLLLWNPDVILFAPDSIFETASASPPWRELDAIKNGSCHKVPAGPYNWMGFPPGVNRFLGMLWLAKLLYPEAAQYDLYEKTAEYYDLFYHCDLSEAQFLKLTEDALP